MEFSVRESEDSWSETRTVDSPIVPIVDDISETLDTCFERSDFEPRSQPVGLHVTSQSLARHWQELADTKQDISLNHEHYLDRILAGETGGEGQVQLTNDFLVELTQFVVDGLSDRIRELRLLQQELLAELLKFKCR